MLDISRSKVPTLETLFDLVDMFSGWKINHLELYTEHTFAYENHREVWAQASPMTGEDILSLDAYCRERFIELVPNQNSFGHMHHWLELPRYNHLAECPEGFELTLHGHTSQMPPFSLNPTDPRSVEFMGELFSELLPHFSSEKFNVGCDETWDVGRGRSARAVEEKGAGRVYLDYLLGIHDLVKRHRRTMHFWGDIIIQHPELVPELPEMLWCSNGATKPTIPSTSTAPSSPGLGYRSLSVLAPRRGTPSRGAPLTASATSATRPRTA